MTSDAHAVLVAAIGATVPGAAWRWCRTHYAATLMAACPDPGSAGSFHTEALPPILGHEEARVDARNRSSREERRIQQLGSRGTS